MRHPDPHFGYHTVSWRARDRVAELSTPPGGHGFLRQGTLLLNTHVDAIDLDGAAQRILTWGSRHQSRIVTVCRMHTLVKASHDRDLHRGVARADLVLPGDAGVAWAMRREGQRTQRPVTGQALMRQHLALAEQTGQAVHFHGADTASVQQLLTEVQSAFPSLQVTCSSALTEAGPCDDTALVQQIATSTAQVVFLGLDEATQAAWMSEHRGRVRAVMVGLGPDFGARPTAGENTWQALRARITFFARVTQSLLLGTPLSAHDDPR